MGKNKNIEKLDDEMIDNLMEYSIKFDDQSDQNIRSKFYKNANFGGKQMGNKKIASVVAIASTFIFSTLVYANVIDLSHIYQNLFGNNKTYVDEKVVNVDMSDVDNGIEAKVISTFMTSENELNVIFTLRDITGDGRITEESGISSYNLTGENISSDVSSSSMTLDFNEETGTGVYLINSYNPLGFDGEITFKLNDITNGGNLMKYTKFDVAQNIDIYEKINGYNPNVVTQTNLNLDGTSYKGDDVTYEDVKKLKILKPDEMIIPFNSVDFAEISNIGFVDGKFHVQTKQLSDIKNKRISDLYIKSNDIKYESNVNIDFYSDDEKIIYEEYVFTEITSLDELQNSQILINYIEQNEDIKASFEFKFEKPDVTSNNIVDKKTNVVIGNNTVVADEISLTPLGVDLIITSDEQLLFRNDNKENVYILYNDGTTANLVRGSNFTSKNNDNYSTRISYISANNTPIKIDDVTEIIINGQTFKVK